MMLRRTMALVWRRALTLTAVGAIVGLLLMSSTGTALADYGKGAVYQIEISANVTSPNGGGIWLWITLNADHTGDYAGSDCGHGEGAASDRGDVTWTQSGDELIISGVTLAGLGGLPVTITVPADYGHHSYSAADNPFGAIFGLPFPGGFAQVQVAP